MQVSSTHITIARGTVESFIFKNNIPLPCHDVNSDSCYIDAVVEFPNDDRSCSQSTPVLIESAENPCSYRIYGSEFSKLEQVKLGIRSDSELFDIDTDHEFFGNLILQTGQDVTVDISTALQFKVMLL